METDVIRIDPASPDPGAIVRAADVLARGGLVALPTETVYGLGARADDAAAVARIFAAKGRPAYNPLIVHVAGEDAARGLASRWPALASKLAAAFWPGPLTLVVPRDRARVPDAVCAGGDTVAVRCPAHPVALALLKEVPFGVAAPSANRFQSLSPTTAAHVLKGLAGRVDLVLDAGPCDRGIESTVVDVSGEVPVLLRPGALARTALEAVAGPLADPSPPAEEGAARRSPGMDRKHYAPRARMVMARGDAVEEALRSAGTRVGLVTWRARERRDVERLPDDPAGYGARLYAALHALDDAGCDAIVVEELPDSPGWEAVRDRLARACG
ncbi:MAG: L-threonylcarbamoyladenylate synthase [Polyangiales bacterium]